MDTECVEWVKERACAAAPALMFVYLCVWLCVFLGVCGDINIIVCLLCVFTMFVHFTIDYDDIVWSTIRKHKICVHLYLNVWVVLASVSAPVCSCVRMWQYTLYKQRNHVPSSSSSSSSSLKRERVGRVETECAIELTPANSLHLLHFHHRLLCFASQRNGQKIATTINNDSFVNHLQRFWMSQVSLKDFHYHKKKIGMYTFTHI